MQNNVTQKIENKTRINENGRIVIPAEIRQKLGLNPGDTLYLTVEGDTLKIESHQMRIRRVQESLRRLIPPDRVLSEELIAERREEARREMEDWLG
jgi:AbrB family looped-hinge helix DNA binding protein